MKHVRRLGLLALPALLAGCAVYPAPPPPPPRAAYYYAPPPPPPVYVAPSYGYPPPYRPPYRGWGWRG